MPGFVFYNKPVREKTMVYILDEETYRTGFVAFSIKHAWQNEMTVRTERYLVLVQVL